LNDFNSKIIQVDIQNKLNCKSRNATFQKKLISFIDSIIISNYDKDDEKNNRFFNKKIVNKKLQDQNNKCNICHRDLSNVIYHADHIDPWSNGGKTEYSNLQVLCKPCHQTKN
jgi:hypothetical protein